MVVTALAAAPFTATAARDAITWGYNLDGGHVHRVNVAVTGGKARLRDSSRSPADIRSSRARGSATFEPRSMRHPVNRVRTDVTADVPSGAAAFVYVRGRTPHGWTEWYASSAHSPATLPSRVKTVQVRLALRAGSRTDPEAGPTVSGISMTADNAHRATTRAESRQPKSPHTYTVFATREGLVGETTANGHVITNNDRFVALPSTRSLSSEGSGDYTVKVCSPETGRCAFAPVWDVGPWNIHDDYWNPASVREMWAGLPQGTPEAAAAYSDGYNGGKDGSGREVVNPAGIDLADGAFRHDVGLRDNAWVKVTYLWTGTYPATGTVVTGGAPLHIRSGPGSDSATVGYAAPHATVPIHCQTRAEQVSGQVATTDLWNKVGEDMYVSDAYVHTDAQSHTAPAC